jgi:hypothetical protein
MIKGPGLINEALQPKCQLTSTNLCKKTKTVVALEFFRVNANTNKNKANRDGTTSRDGQ